jgi:hypothetical protein
VDLTATATGTNQSDSASIAAPAYASIAVTSSLSSVVSVLPAEVKEGGSFMVVFAMTNNNSTAAANPTAALLPVDTNLVSVAGGPWPDPSTVSVLNGNSTIMFTWTLTAKKAGAVSFTASGTGDFGSLPLDATQAASSLTIKRAVDIPDFAGESLVYPNPVTGDTITFALHLEDAMSLVAIDVYNTGFQRVYHGEWPNQNGGSALFEIAGARHWAPGIYRARVTATRLGGGTQPFKTFVIAVKAKP